MKDTIMNYILIHFISIKYKLNFKMLWYNWYFHIVYHIIHKVIALYLIANGITTNYKCYTI